MRPIAAIVEDSHIKEKLNVPKWIHQPNGSMAGYLNRGMPVWTAEQGAINPPRVAVSHAPDRHKADGGLNVSQDDERAASLDSGNATDNPAAASKV